LPLGERKKGHELTVDKNVLRANPKGHAANITLPRALWVL
jgi:hypothetical protein